MNLPGDAVHMLPNNQTDSRLPSICRYLIRESDTIATYHKIELQNDFSIKKYHYLVLVDEPGFQTQTTSDY